MLKQIQIYFNLFSICNSPAGQMVWQTISIIQMQPEHSQESPEIKLKPFTLDLTPDQHAFLLTKVPILYSIHQVKKTVKRVKKDIDGKLLDQIVSATNLLPRSSRYLESSNIEGSETQIQGKRSRPKKINDYHDQQAPKRKPKQPLIRASTTYSEAGLTQQQATQCSSIIAQLKRNQNSKPFIDPVNPVELGIPDYFEVVSNPMDISTIQKKLRSRAYSTFKQFKDDLTLIWMNSYKYNQKGSDIYYMTAEMDKLSNKLLQKKTSGEPFSSSYSATTTPTSVSQLNAKRQTSTPSVSKIPKKPPSINKVVDRLRPMTIVEKRKLCDDIKSLQKEHLAGVWKIVSQNNDSPDLTFDIEKLPVNQLWQLDAYVKDKKSLQSMNVQMPAGDQNVSQKSSSFVVDSDSQK